MSELVLRMEPPRRDFGVSRRKREILKIPVQRETIQAPAVQLEIGYYTAYGYVRCVYAQLRVTSRGGASAKAIHEGLVPPATSL